MYEKPNLTPFFVRAFVVVLAVLLLFGLIAGRLNAPTTTIRSSEPTVQINQLESQLEPVNQELLNAGQVTETVTDETATDQTSEEGKPKPPKKRGCSGDH